MIRLIRTVLAVAAATSLAVLPAVPAAADLEDDLAEVLGQIEDLEGNLQGAAVERVGIVAEILDTRDRLEAARATRDEAEESLRRLRVSLVTTEADLELTKQQLKATLEAIKETRRRLEAGRADAQDWVRRQYMRQSEGDMASALVSTDHVSDLGLVMYYLGAVADRSTASIDRYEALGAEEERQQGRIEDREDAIQTQRDALAAAEVEQTRLTAKSQAAAEMVREELAHQKALLAELDTIIDEFETELVGLDEEQDRLERLIREASGGGGTSPGQLVRPVPGKITSSFGPRLHPILGYARMHTGVDMAAPHGQEIRAGAAGVVVLAATYGGYGLTVVIDHGGGMTTLYAHQSRLRVAVGERVETGEAIGEAGSSGLATGPHLHFEVRIDGAPVDPENYL